MYFVKLRLLIALALLAVSLSACAGGSFANAMRPFANPAVTMPLVMQGQPYSYSTSYSQPQTVMQFPSGTQMSCYQIGNTINCRAF